MYRFDWSIMATPELLRRLALAAGLGSDYSGERLKPFVTRILAAVGGLPLCDAELTAEERTESAQALLHEGLRRLLRRLARLAAEGYHFRRSSVASLGNEVQAWTTVNINTADVAALEALPRIGPELARRIVEERIKNGRFVSLEDLDRRVAGIGKETVRQLATVLVAAEANFLRCAPPDLANDFARDLGALVDLQEASSRAIQLERALELLAMECATAPHPATRDHRVRAAAPALGGTEVAAEWVGVLWGDEYWNAMPALIRTARTRVDICMFHIAAPSNEHPTMRLLEALRDSRQAGVQVRVLVDRDNRDDPYLSTIINTPAKRLLSDFGIECRFDTGDKLLHSKFLIFDNELAVIGSHNWTTGSYFEYDDLSLAIRSRELVGELTRRFEELWTASGP